ncbi:predicted protein [Postia placenta Mad-698-R]|uniref:Membrane-associated protein n=1 Tax=Postia placenta MAD-698-R-SB12 TaxID=670580 RepID=A0A1X6NBP9_9APHY|nr:hypothetical protein POSPLADRAFT_1130873 [Postia placenta MAD-698-R-SB12]EED85422.1 predicted protein [Postia placenta Mad-698-R]OSX66068.1 hypothetical protein POSPLADRAFT_1130873 [Postia placenta MAD-698-R-SB12]
MHIPIQLIFTALLALVATLKAPSPLDGPGVVALIDGVVTSLVDVHEHADHFVRWMVGTTTPRRFQLLDAAPQTSLAECARPLIVEDDVVFTNMSIIVDDGVCPAVWNTVFTFDIVVPAASVSSGAVVEVVKALESMYITNLAWFTALVTVYVVSVTLLVKHRVTSMHRTRLNVEAGPSAPPFKPASPGSPETSPPYSTSLQPLVMMDFLSYVHDNIRHTLDHVLSPVPASYDDDQVGCSVTFEEIVAEVSHIASVTDRADACGEGLRPSSRQCLSVSPKTDTTYPPIDQGEAVSTMISTFIATLPSPFLTGSSAPVPTTVVVLDAPLASIVRSSETEPNDEAKLETLDTSLVMTHNNIWGDKGLRLWLPPAHTLETLPSAPPAITSSDVGASAHADEVPASPMISTPVISGVGASANVDNLVVLPTPENAARQLAWFALCFLLARMQLVRLCLLATHGSAPRSEHNTDGTQFMLFFVDGQLYAGFIPDHARWPDGSVMFPHANDDDDVSREAARDNLFETIGHGVARRIAELPPNDEHPEEPPANDEHQYEPRRRRRRRRRHGAANDADLPGAVSAQSDDEITSRPPNALTSHQEPSQISSPLPSSASASSPSTSRRRPVIALRGLSAIRNILNPAVRPRLGQAKNKSPSICTPTPPPPPRPTGITNVIVHNASPNIGDLPHIPSASSSLPITLSPRRPRQVAMSVDHLLGNIPVRFVSGKRGKKRLISAPFGFDNALDVLATGQDIFPPPFAERLPSEPSSASTPPLDAALVPLPPSPPLS